MIRVAVIGAAGRMGRMVCRTVWDAPDVQLSAAIDRVEVDRPIGELIGIEGAATRVSDRLDSVLEGRSDVVVDFTQPDAVMGSVRWAVQNGVHIVVGTTGVTPDDVAEIRDLLGAQPRSNVVVVPNFALGAVLAQRFAAEASRYFPAVEVIELHHDGKADAPSGTALATARRLAETRREGYRGPDAETLKGSRGGDVDGVRVHSVRLPGLLAHQEVLFGGPGEVLTIRHDSLDRSSFMPGVLLAIRDIAKRPGLTVGLEPMLEGGSG